ncbi:MAG: polysaccharide biosynthesis tyrosine autokinase, partial [Bacteroidota bacterium]
KKLLRQSEIEYKSYQAEHRLMDIKNQSLLATRGIDNLFDERINTQLQINAYQNIDKILASSQSGDQTIIPGSFSLKDNYVTSQLNNLSKLQQDRATRILNLTPDHPSIVALDKQIQTNKSQLHDFLNQSTQEAQRKLLSINQRINDYQSLQSTLPIEDKQLNELARRFENDRENYEKLLDRRFEAQIGLETNTPDIKIIEEAKKEKDRPIKPNTKFIYLFSLILGFGFPMGFILVSDMINNKVQSKQDIRDATKIPFLGMIADGGKKSKLLALDRPKSLASESFRSIRLGLEDVLKDRDHQQVIGITSTIDGEGKTFCSINLGLSYATQEYKTLLLIADLYKDQLHKYFKVSGPGLTEYLKGTASFGEVTKDTPSDYLHIIPAGDLPKSPSAVMKPEKIAALLEQARVHYDKIIIDIPPIGYVSDYFDIENYLDATVYLIRYNYSSKKLLDEINEQYENKRVNQVHI